MPLTSLPLELRDAAECVALHPPATCAQIAEAASRQELEFPADYVSFLLESNGAELQLGESTVILYAVDELNDLNDEDDGEELFPSHLRVFGSNGGSEKLAFDRRVRPHSIVVVPHYRPRDEDAIVQGTTLHELLARACDGAWFHRG